MEIIGDLHPGLVQVRPVQSRQTVHRQHRDAPAGEHPGKIVVDEGIGVVGPPGQHHGKGTRLLRLGDDLLPLFHQLAAEGLNGSRRLAVGLLGLPLGGTAVIHGVLADLPLPVFLRKPVEHRRLKAHGEMLLRRLEIAHHHGVAHDDRADIGALFPLVLRGHMEDVGQEDSVYPLLGQVQHMTVDQLGRKADGIRCHILKAALILFAAAGAGIAHLVAQGPEESAPEGHAVPELQHSGQADGLPLALPHRGDRIGLEEHLTAQAHEVRHLGGLLRRQALALRHHGAPITPVAGHKTAPIREAKNRAAAVVGAVRADHAALPGVCKLPHRVEADESRTAAVGVAVGLHLLFDRKSRAQSAHFAGVWGQGHLPAQIFLQSPEDREVPEGSALDHHPISQFRDIGDPNHLGKDVFDNGPAKARHQVIRLLAVALFIDDGAVHEHGAPAAQLRGTPGTEGGLGHLVHRHSQRGGKIFQERPAAGGTGLVEHDVGDHTILEPDGLHVLAADVQQEGGIREKAAAAPGVGHGLHCVVIRVERRGKHLLPVTGGTQAQHLQPDPLFPVFLCQSHESLPHHPQGFSLVIGVEGVRHLLILIHKDELGGGGPGVNAKIPPQHVPVCDVYRLPQFRQMAAEKGVPLRIAGKVGLSRSGGILRLGRSMIQSLQRLSQGYGVLLTGEKLIHGDGGSPGHNGLRMLRADNVLFRKMQPLREHPHQRGVEGQRTALKDDGRRQLQSLRETTDGLLGDGMEGGKGDIRPLCSLDQQRLDVRLGKHTAPAGDAVNRLSPGGQLLKFVRRNVQQRRDLINKCSGTAGAAAVHPHVGGLEPAGVLVIVEKDHLGILAPQLHGGADIGVQRPNRRRVGHDLLDIVRSQSGSDGPSTGTADADPEPGIGKPPGRFCEKLPDGSRLVGIMPLIAGKQNTVGIRVQDHGFHSRGPHIHAEAQDIGICLCHICSFQEALRQNQPQRPENAAAKIAGSFPTTVDSGL
ncbi:unknown [Oscillibacter sp. CAG:155]|nr:unknown [Oscillibacter sp. CAG:155]